jgi:hypothetical protein
MISDRDLVLAAAATYTPNAQATFAGLGGAARAYRTVVDDTAVYAIEGTHSSWEFRARSRAISTKR